MSEQEAVYGDYPPTEVQRTWTSGDGTEWFHPAPAQPTLPSPEAEQGMDEALSYRWAARAMRGVEGRIEPHHLASLADLISSAILQAYHLGEKERQDLAQLLQEALELAKEAIGALSRAPESTHGTIYARLSVLLIALQEKAAQAIDQKGD